MQCMVNMTKLVQAMLCSSMPHYGAVVMAVLLLFMSGLLAGAHIAYVKADDNLAHAGEVTTQLNTEDTSIQTLNLRRNMNLSDYIWDGATDLLSKAWNTTFIAGVANGSMNPNFYGNYVLQDAIYCRIVAQLWVQLANNASVDEKVREYANKSDFGFQSDSISQFEEWNVKDDWENDYGVIVREPVIEYVTFIKDAMLKYPPNMLIATYACLKLWNNLTRGLLPIVENSINNPYGVWVYENYEDGSSAQIQATQMDEWDQQYQWYNWSEALSLFRSALLNEINFFNHAGNFSGILGLHTMQHSKYV